MTTGLVLTLDRGIVRLPRASSKPSSSVAIAATSSQNSLPPGSSIISLDIPIEVEGVDNPVNASFKDGGFLVDKGGFYSGFLVLVAGGNVLFSIKVSKPSIAGETNLVIPTSSTPPTVFSGVVPLSPKTLVNLAADNLEPLPVTLSVALVYLIL